VRGRAELIIHESEIITYSGCVYVVLFIHDAQGMHSITLSSLACLAVSYIFPHYISQTALFQGNLIEKKM